MTLRIGQLAERARVNVQTVRFYERRGFQVVSDDERDRLLQRYWTVPPGQIAASVVLADQRWRDT